VLPATPMTPGARAPGPAPDGHDAPGQGYPELDDDTLQVRAVPGNAALKAGAGPGRTAGGPVTRPPRGPGRGQGTRGRARPRGPRWRARALVAGGVAVAVIAAGAAYEFVFRHGHSGTPSTSDQAATLRTPTAAGPPPSLGPWGYIASRTTDPIPLTLSELFPAQFASGGLTYSMTVDKSRVHCNLAVIGSQLQSAVGQADCTQAMIASYLSSNQQLMGTIGVLNLSTAAGAESAGKATGPSEFVAQLPGPTGPTKNLASGTGIEAADVQGHYLVLVWAELASLKAPSTAAQKQEIQSFISLLIQKTANVSLASRQVTGKPAT
jgi:hypothetical protein